MPLSELARGKGSRGSHLALLLVLALLTSMAAGAAAAPSHEDPASLAQDEAAIREAAEKVRDQGLLALRAALDGDNTTALGQAGAAQDSGRHLAHASSLPVRNVTLVPLLERLGPPSGRLGGGLWNVTNASLALLDGNLSAVGTLLARESLNAGLDQVRPGLEAYQAEGIETGDLNALLDQLLERLGKAPSPEGPDAALVPARVPLGDLFKVLVLDPAHPGRNVTINALGQATEKPFDDVGIARTLLRVPWTSETGTHPVELSWGRGPVTLNLTVTRVPTTLKVATLPAAGDNRTVTASLLDHNQRPVPHAPVAWSLGNETGGVSTDERGHIRLTLPASIHQVTLAYAGNRTHAPASATATLFATSPTLSPTSPTLSPTLLLLGAGLLILLVAGGYLAVKRRRVDPVEGQEQDPARDRPSATQALRPDHPLVAALERAGYPANSLTLREAADIWEALGASGVRPWVRAHERAYYGGHDPPPVPQELVRWAEGLR